MLSRWASAPAFGRYGVMALAAASTAALNSASASATVAGLYPSRAAVTPTMEASAMSASRASMMLWRRQNSVRAAWRGLSVKVCPVTGSDVEPCALEDVERGAERGGGVKGEPVVNDRFVELGATCSRAGQLRGLRSSQWRGARRLRRRFRSWAPTYRRRLTAPKARGTRPCRRARAMDHVSAWCPWVGGDRCRGRRCRCRGSGRRVPGCAPLPRRR